MADEPQPEPTTVRHNRKEHYTADPERPANEDKPTTAPSASVSSLGSKAAANRAKLEAGVRAVAAAIPGAPAAPLVAVPLLYTRGGRLIMPPALKGSHEILVHQNAMADQDGLIRIHDDTELERMRGSGELVPVPAVQGLEQDERLPINRRYCRPWTASFLQALARAHYARFHTPLQVNSAVRTVEFQQRLMTRNGNAAPAQGETASPHLTGQAVDLAKKGLSMAEIAWLRGYLLPLVQAGKVDVEEEFQQSCFHISVYRKYLPETAPRREINGHPATPGTALAVAIP